MKNITFKWLVVALLGPWLSLAQDRSTATGYEAWRHSGSIYVLTTPEGANWPASATVEGFPLLVRLHRDWFDFTQAKAKGEDVRFSTSTGAPLAHQTEEWDAAKGTASIWVRVPLIKGHERQELRIHLGKSDAANESSGSAVFNESNGYLSVWHMNGPVKDEVGTLESKDVGTTTTTGMIGEARHLAGKQGIFGGDKIPDTIALEFDQPVVWTDTLAGQFYLDGEKDKVASGSVTGNVLTLKLKAASTATKITYLKEVAWSQDTLLNGANGLAALTFCNVPILAIKPSK